MELHPPRDHNPEWAWRQLCADYRSDEAAHVGALLAALSPPGDARRRIAGRAAQLVALVRGERGGRGSQGALDAFLQEYGLSTREGVILMCLAEALLRIPDPATADKLIRDKLGEARWEQHLGHSDSLLVNFSTWALLLTGRIITPNELSGESASSLLKNHLLERLGEPVVRRAMAGAMRIMGRQFVMGRTIAEALSRAAAEPRREVRYSFDMLGEAALRRADAARYLDAYHGAISAIGRAAAPPLHDSNGSLPYDRPGISVKLSALHPRYHYSQHEKVVRELTPLLGELAAVARRHGIGLTVDAEEAHNLLLSLAVIERVSAQPALRGWNGFGLAVQAYQKRALSLLQWLAALARRDRRRWMVRLVKGAYWDAEIKRAQEDGLPGYPVFTRKPYTDVSYLACARYLLAERDSFYPQFATHNAHTVAAVLEMAAPANDLEFQRLHGMGEPLYRHLGAVCDEAPPCRVYAPVGRHEDLLAYLVRRLLENGANTSFVNRIIDEQSPIEDIVADPLQKSAALAGEPHPRIPLPRDLYRPERANAGGVDLSDPLVTAALCRRIEAAAARRHEAAPLLGHGADGSNGAGTACGGAARRSCRDPANRERIIGTVREAGERELRHALACAAHAWQGWDAAGGEERARCLERAADLMERDCAELMALAIREAGKTVADAVAEVREAVDFCRYYAARGRALFGETALPGPTGESNTLRLHGRGVFVCISPWNFPLAIFSGQLSAALMAGNAVLAKPAEQTPLIAHHATRLFHEAGVPPAVLQLLPGDGGQVGARLVAAPATAGVAFTGSTETAHAIQQALAARGGPIVPLIAETGGQNAMIVDSSALPEQVIEDVITSAFRSAGQRCSALRVLYVQEDIAGRVTELLQGAMAELQFGDPGRLDTDVGPVIDDEALRRLEAHARHMERSAALIYRCQLPPEISGGAFFAPGAWRIQSIRELEREVFGPVLHVVHYTAGELNRILDDINDTGYGLTLGIHSRINTTVRHIIARARVGNIYVNRNQIGAVVGVQPFGGEGLSGTGPKAGGPHYLQRFAVERSVCINTTAQGGDAALMTLD